jgi:hypothetical protein
VKKTEDVRCPNISGHILAFCYYGGAFSMKTDNYGHAVSTTVASGNHGLGVLALNASNSNAVYGNSNTITPPGIRMSFIVRYM